MYKSYKSYISFAGDSVRLVGQTALAGSPGFVGLFVDLDLLVCLRVRTSGLLADTGLGIELGSSQLCLLRQEPEVLEEARCNAMLL